MAKILYGLFCIGIIVFLLPLSLNFRGNIAGSNSIALPSYKQIKTAISITSPGDSENSGAAADFSSQSEIACQDSRSSSIGFPFAYKKANGCHEGRNYTLGLWLDYLVVFLVTLGITKAVSIMINRLSKRFKKTSS